MKPYTVPADLTVLTDEELDNNLTAAVKSFQSESQTTTVTDATLPTLRSLKAAIQAIKQEKQNRITAAEEAAAEIDQLSADVFGESDSDTEVTAEVEETPSAELVVASGEARRPAISLAHVRERQPKFAIPTAVEPGLTITAAVDVPGFRPGQEFELSDVTEGVIRRASGLKTAGGGVGMVASYNLPFSPDLIVTDASSAPQGSTAVMKASEQRRLPKGSLIASGGWCAPSETVYDITDIACPDMLWDLPEIQLSRGGIRFFRPPVLDVAALTWIHTEQDDIANATKPCFKVPCATPIDVRAEAIGVCIEAGILTERYFPELVSWYVRNAMVAHEIRVKAAMYDAARAAATAVTTTASFGAFSAVYGAVALQAADMIERYNLCDGTALEVVFPFWAKNMFLADIARQQDVNACDLANNCIEEAFATIGVRVQFARGLAPDVPTNIGNATPAVAWPADMEFLIYPAGSLQIGRGPEINLGAIYDSTKFTTNDYTALFSEEGIVFVDRLGLSRRVTVTVCANGAVGPRAAAVCPIA
jgi:hypothetical protein